MYQIPSAVISYPYIILLCCLCLHLSLPLSPLSLPSFPWMCVCVTPFIFFPTGVCLHTPVSFTAPPSTSPPPSSFLTPAHYLLLGFSPLHILLIPARPERCKTHVYVCIYVYHAASVTGDARVRVCVCVSSLWTDIDVGV